MVYPWDEFSGPGAAGLATTSTGVRPRIGLEGSMARFQCYRTETGEFRWRLLGGNNRVLGSCVRQHADHVSSIREVEAVRAVIDTVRVEFERTPGGLWWWQMYLSNRPVARSGQGFARKIDADLAARRFRARTATAEVDTPLMLFQPGRRGRPN
jgi:hypothetical protein